VNFLREMAGGFIVMVNGWLSLDPRKNPDRAAIANTPGVVAPV
jgi:hypothetical protein